MPLPESWSLVEAGVRDQWQLRNVKESEKKSNAAIDAATILVTFENRLSHDDAVNRLGDIANEQKSQSRYLLINGWPALQRRHLGPMSWRGSQRPADGVPDAWRVTTAVAIGDQIVRFEGFALPSSANSVLDEMESLAAGIKTGAAGDAAAGAAALQRLRSRGGPPKVAAPAVVAAPEVTGNAAVTGADAGFSLRINNGNTGNGVDSEIEVAVSADGRHIVVGNNGRDFMVSNNGGQTFTQATVNPPFGANGDPSLAWGRSGNFYYAFIGFPDGTAGANNFQGCAISMTRSTDNGQTFTFTEHAARCAFTGAGMCFTDQEHIAADRWNAAAGGDQVYNVWRNFTPSGTPPANCTGIGGGFVAPLLTCSQDSSVNWTGGVSAGNGDFPRVTAGRDGFVYVTTWNGANLEINKFSSCAAGLAQQAGWPRVVANVAAFDCNLPGHDRCDQNPASNTVSVDELNPNNVFVAYAETTAAGTNDNVTVHASTDGGATWSGGALANAPVPGRRYMPWLCTIGGEAHVTWYRPAQQHADPERFHGVLGRDRGAGRVRQPLLERGLPDLRCRRQRLRIGLAVRHALGGERGNLLGPAAAGGEVQRRRGAMRLLRWLSGRTGYLQHRQRLSEVRRLQRRRLLRRTPLRGVGIGDLAARRGSGVHVDRRVLLGEDHVLRAADPGAERIELPADLRRSSSNQTLNVCNTGKENLEVNSITSSNPRFSVATPSSGYPVVISPDFCFPFQATFTPTAGGPQSATFTINSNDTVNPAVQVSATATGGAPALSVTGSGEFGAVCSATAAERVINVCNTGTCALSVTSAVPSCSDFTVVNNPFPASVGAGECIPVTVKYTPQSLGAHSCNLAVATSAGDRNIPLTATTPAPALSVGPDLSFPATVTQSVGSCQSTLPVVIANTGLCPATVNSVTIGGINGSNYSLSGAPGLPITIAPGEQVGDGTLTAVFRPDQVDRDRIGTLTVNWLSIRSPTRASTSPGTCAAKAR